MPQTSNRAAARARRRARRPAKAPARAPGTAASGIPGSDPGASRGPGASGGKAPQAARAASADGVRSAAPAAPTFQPGMPARPRAAPKGPAVPDEPATPQEIAESHALASRHLALVRQALRGLRAPARRKGRDRPQRAGKTPPDGAHPECGIATVALLLVDFCRRGDCRRTRRCRFGRRTGEDSSQSPPCLMTLPRAARLALPFALARRHAPTAFRDPDFQRAEDEAIRCARIALEDRQLGGPATR